MDDKWKWTYIMSGVLSATIGSYKKQVSTYTVNALVVGGGGAGGSSAGGGGGAGTYTWTRTA
jgi:hypothetical protein